MGNLASVTTFRDVQPNGVPTLANLTRQIQEVSTLPHVALRLIEVANDPNAGAGEMKQILEADVALSARVLRCVNSSAYAIRTKVTNLQHAIIYLGVKQVCNLAMTASVSRLFEKDDKIGCYNRKALWRHMIAVGICARLIAMRLRFSDFEEVFLAGLLHDIGIILEDQHVHSPFVDIINRLRPEDSLRELERQQLGFDHTILGNRLATAWRLPNCVVDTIRYHHDTTRYNGKYASTVRCVELANFICSLKGMSSIGLHLVEFPRSSMLALALGKEDLVVLANDLDRELLNSQYMFQI